MYTIKSTNSNNCFFIGFKIGDRVTSSGLDGVYPRGLLVGIITEISSRPDSMFHDVVVRPSIDMEKIESVYIVSSQRSEVR